jgi:hypothetical protein
MSFPDGRPVDSPPDPPEDGVPEDGIPEDGATQNGAHYQRALEQWRSDLLRLNRLLPENLSSKVKALGDWSLHGWSSNRLSLNRIPLKNLSLNRGDLLLLLAGVVAFLMLTFLPGIVAPGNTGGRAGSDPATAPYSRSADLAMPGYAVPPDTFPWSGKGSPTTAPAAQEPPPSLPIYPPAAAPTRIVYPAAGLDVVIHPLTPTREELESQAIVPPITVDGYWVSDFGMPGAGSTNTTYILGHSWEGRDAPFNRLSAASAPGDIFEATTASGTMRYRVDSVDTYVKASLKDSPIWTAVPNRLVLISCYTEDPWGKNVVVVASPVPNP